MVLVLHIKSDAVLLNVWVTLFNRREVNEVKLHPFIFKECFPCLFGRRCKIKCSETLIRLIP